MTELIPVISDLQVPYHDKRAVSAVATLLADISAERVLCVGDVLDQPQVSQWTRGRKGEHAGDLAKDRDLAVSVMRDLGITDLSRSNHDDRVEKYVAEHAPGLAGLPELSIEQFMGLNELGITFHRQPTKVAPGWLMGHGDEGSISQIPGQTAMRMARKAGMSFVCGHTHRVGLTHDNASYAGKKVRSIFGFEVGNLMDMKFAKYLGGGSANWQHAIGMLVVDGNDVYPMPIVIEKGKLYWDGHTYRG